MPQLELFYAPTACCDAALISLEHLDVPYELRLVRFAKGDHRKPEYLSHNPQGKVPLLLVDGKPLTENVAILSYLAKAHPQAGLLPFGKSEYEDAKIVADLAWVASGLHPLVTRLFMPSKICDVAEGVARVKAIAGEAMQSNLTLIEQRLADRDWMYGAWSALDAYVFWVHNRLEVSGFDLSPFPRYRAHAQRMLALPAVKRAWAKRTALQDQLKAEGITRPPAAVQS